MLKIAARAAKRDKTPAGFTIAALIVRWRYTNALGPEAIQRPAFVRR